MIMTAFSGHGRKSMATMSDLRNAIYNVVASYPATLEDGVLVSKPALWNLQQEYNIHFVEPEDPQLEVIEKP